MSQTISIGAGALVPVPSIITPIGSYANPLPHCSLRQVKSLLRGQDLSRLADDDGTLDGFWNDVQQIYIPDATKRAVGMMRTNYDWSRETWFFNGNGTQDLTLPRRQIAYVNAVFLRVLPSLMWYRFTHIRNADGSEFPRIGGIEPPRTPAESIPPDLNGLAQLQAVNQQGQQVQVDTGLEDADLILDPRSRTLSIPPRVLYSAVNTPLYNWSFFKGTMNVEVHFVYGFPPTAYADGTPLVFNPYSGAMNATSSAGTPVDWSSGMPVSLSMAVARFAAAEILRLTWRGTSQGLSSLSIDGASESYGSNAFGGEPDRLEARAEKDLQPYGIRVK